jgi:carbonic anhydrase
MSQGVNHVAMIGHNDCGMTRAIKQAPRIVDAYVSQGWSREAAQKFVDKQQARYHMKDELDGLQDEYNRLRSVFRKLVVAPLFVSLYDSRLYIPTFYLESLKNDSFGSYSVSDETIDQL